MALELGEQGQVRDALVGIGCDPFQDDFIVAQQPGDRHRVKQVGVVNQRDTKTLRLLPQVQLQIESRCPPGNTEWHGAQAWKFQGAQLDPRQFQWFHQGVLDGEHHLGQGVAAQVPVRLKFLHQLLKRDVLVGIGLQSHLAHPPQKLPETGIARRIAAHHQGIDEEADQSLEFFAGPICNRGAHDDVVLARVALEQDLQGRQQRHE